MPFPFGTSSGTATLSSGRPRFADNPDTFKSYGTDGWDLDKTLGNISTFGSKYVDWLADEETRRYDESAGIARSAMHDFDKPSMTDADIRTQFAGGADEAAREFNANMRGLRTSLGGAGVTGGARAQGQAINYGAQMNRVLIDTRRQLYEKRVQADMLDRTAKFQAEMAAANAINQAPSAAPMDWLGQMGSTILDKYTIDRQAIAAKQAAKASKKAGQMDFLGKLEGAAIGAFL